MTSAEARQSMLDAQVVARAEQAVWEAEQATKGDNNSGTDNPQEGS
jgi:hypothetical protein